MGVALNPERTAQDAVRVLLAYIGEDVGREGLRDTPKRVVKSYQELFSGYELEPKEILSRTFDDPDQKFQEMVILKNIEFFSMCEHHMLPFYGQAHIAYLPNGKVVGISKLARLLECFARRLQIQERLTTAITEALESILSPLGAACVISARHHCICSRGIGKQHSEMVTSSVTGVFKNDPTTRAEFFAMIGAK